MGLLYDKNRALGRTFRYEADFADSGGSIVGGGGFGGGFGGADSGGQDAAFGGGFNAPAGPMGPPTESQAQAAAQEFANSLSPFEAAPVDAVIVPLVPLTPVQIKTDPVPNVEQVQSTTVNVGALLNRGAEFLMGLFGISTGTPMGAVGGLRSVTNAVLYGPPVFGSTTTDVITFSGSGAPAVVAAGGTGAAAAAASFAGAADSGAGDQAGNGAISGAPVLGFGGAFVNNPSPTGAGSTAGGLSLTPSSSAAAALRGRYAAPVGPAAAAPAISPAVIAAGLASLLFLG